MEIRGESNNCTLLVSAPIQLNLACFVQHAAGLISYAGYHQNESYHWPYQDHGFRDIVDATTFLEAAYQWDHWWSILLNERYHIVQENLDEEWSDRCLPPSLDSYPALRQAVAMVWPAFWSWWSYPYVGGKMALESTPSLSLLFDKLQAMAPGHWHWDLVFCEIPREIRYQAPYGWGVGHPHDFWGLDWMTPQVFQKPK